MTASLSNTYIGDPGPINPQAASTTANLNSTACEYVEVIERRKNTVLCSLPEGGDIELSSSSRRWYKSSIDYAGDVAQCYAYTGRSGKVYYT